MLFVANYVASSTTGGYFSAPADSNPLLNTWSLSVEDQFYLVFPIVLLVSWALARRRWRPDSVAAVAIASITAASFGLLVLGVVGIEAPGVSVPPSFFSAFTRAWEFGIGGLLLLALRRWPLSSSTMSTVAGLVGAFLLAMSLAVISPATPFPGAATLMPVAATVLLILAGSAGAGVVTRVLSHGSLCYVGDRSYSIYLWHWPLIVFAAALFPGNPSMILLAAGVSLVPAWLSYRYVESSLRQLSPRSPMRAAGVIVALFLPPIALSALLLLAANNGFWSNRVVDLQARDQVRLGVADGCHGPDASFTSIPGPCWFNSSAPGRPVYLVGDSYAEVMGDALSAAATAAGRPFTVHSYGGCPFGGVAIVRSADGVELSPACAQYRERLVEFLTEQPPGTVVVSNADFYLRDPMIHVLGQSGDIAARQADKVSSFESGLAATLGVIKAAGHEIVLIQPIPNFRLDSEEEASERWSGVLDCPMVFALTGACERSAPEPLIDIAARQGAIWSMYDRLGSELGAEVVDFSSQLCPNGTCPTQQGETLMYREYLHLTVDGARKLGPSLATSLRR